MAKKAAVKRVVKNRVCSAGNPIETEKGMTPYEKEMKRVDDVLSHYEMKWVIEESVKLKQQLVEKEEVIKHLRTQLRTLESARETQVEDLLQKQGELMTDIAELLTRCVKVEESE